MNAGIVGLGCISPLHINAILNHGHKIVAICDIEKEKCVKVKATYKIDAKEYANYDEMLDGEKIDVIHICTPHYLHAEMVCKALRRGINVICEKPLAISFEQLGEIEVAVKESKAMLGVCFQNRYNPEVLFLEEFFNDREVKAATVSLTWSRDASYYNSANWRGTKKYEGGGLLINQAIHTLDMIILLCGMPTSVLADCSNYTHGDVIDVEDSAFGIFNLRNNGNVVFSATNSSITTFNNVHMFQTDRDMLELIGGNLTVNGKKIEMPEIKNYLGKKEWGVGHDRLVKDFYECVEQGRKFPIDFYEGSKAVRLVLKMYESNGKFVKV